MFNITEDVIIVQCTPIHTRVYGIAGSASARRWGGYGFNSRLNHVIAKVKNCT